MRFENALPNTDCKSSERNKIPRGMNEKRMKRFPIMLYSHHIIQVINRLELIIMINKIGDDRCPARGLMNVYVCN